MGDRIERDSIQVSFVQEEGTGGWIDLYLYHGKTKVQIRGSIAFPPFEDLFKFLEGLLSNHLPISFSWDEEGRYKRFIAEPHSNSRLFRFILDDSSIWGSAPYAYLNGVFDKKEFVAEYYDKFTNFLLNGYDKNRWVGRYNQLDLKKIDLGKLKSLLGR